MPGETVRQAYADKSDRTVEIGYNAGSGGEPDRHATGVSGR